MMNKKEYIEFMSMFVKLNDDVIRFEQKDIDELTKRMKGRIPEGLDFKFFLIDSPTIQLNGETVYAGSRMYGRNKNYSMMLDDMIEEYVKDFRIRGMTHHFDTYHVGLMTYTPGRHFVRYVKYTPGVTVCSII